MAPPDVAMVTGDLLFASRLRAALGGAALDIVSGDQLPSATTVFVDLNTDVDARLRVIRELRSRGGARIVGFCNHEERELRIRAMADGADQVITNGALQEAALRILQPAGEPRD